MSASSQKPQLAAEGGGRQLWREWWQFRDCQSLYGRNYIGFLRSNLFATSRRCIGASLRHTWGESLGSATFIVGNAVKTPRALYSFLANTAPQKYCLTARRVLSKNTREIQYVSRTFSRSSCRKEVLADVSLTAQAGECRNIV